jgi:methyl-accepting chemotaxis protein
MTSRQKKIIWNQSILFFYVVVIFGLPYLWLTVDPATSQIRPFIVINILQDLLLLGIWVVLPLQWAQPLFALERELAGSKTLDLERATATLQVGARMPGRLALTILSSGYGVFLLGSLAMRLWAEFNLGQTIQGLIVGLLICVVYSLFSLFLIEEVTASLLAAGITRLPRRMPLKGMNLSHKLLITCSSLVLIAILFLSSISFVESKKAIEKQAVEMQQQELRLALRTQSVQKTANSGEEAGLVQVVDGLELMGSGRAYVINAVGTVVASNPQGWQPVLPPGLVGDLRQNGSGSYVDSLHDRIFTYQPVSGKDYFLVSEMERSQLFAPLKTIVWTTGLVCVLTLIIGVYLAYILARNVTRPVSKLGLYARRISQGELGETVALASGDEVGALADSFAHMQENLILLAEQAQRIAEGDLSQRVAFLGSFGEAINTMVGNLREITQQIQEAASRIGRSSGAIVQAAQQQASGAQQQAASVSETTATMEELTTTARQMAENSNAVTAVAEETLRSAEEGQDLMEESMKGMALIRSKTEESSEKIMTLGRKSQQIGEVIEIINEIAVETKMLSLNAAIEAGKAGEAGKGFSVVAAEIRRLAEDVVKSTGTIREVLLEIQAAANASVLAAEDNVKGVQMGAERLGRVQNALENIIAMAEQTTDAARQISVATNQQKEASEQVVRTMREISKVTQQTAGSAKNSISTANDLNHLAEELRSRVSRFKTG